MKVRKRNGTEQALAVNRPVVKIMSPVEAYLDERGSRKVTPCIIHCFYWAGSEGLAVHAHCTLIACCLLLILLLIYILVCWITHGDLPKRCDQTEAGNSHESNWQNVGCRCVLDSLCYSETRRLLAVQISNLA